MYFKSTIVQMWHVLRDEVEHFGNSDERYRWKFYHYLAGLGSEKSFLCMWAVLF